ncbi:MAG: response regulator [Nitrospirae bacterium]|nr:response regulator [Nitrospirota bacterium]MBF0541746.1 response regulator [Nitrospirota bacterium]
MENSIVLLVDDEEDFITPIAKKLKKRHIEVETAPNGEAGLKKLAEGNIDVVVLDVKMPGMDGISTLREIKMKYPLVEVIMLTGHANMEAAVDGMNLGAFDYLMKPMEFDELVFKLQDAVKTRRLALEKIKKYSQEV